MKRLLMEPDGWPCTYEECRPGFFVLGGDVLLKSEYGSQGYCSSGEAFAGSHELVVQPVTAVWQEFEE
ncbi:hypothetical protein [Mesorhizobium retamae]|uniref:Uncharacterized protein n=1 Tax=Mesorhizobium retamae TaxID=2912854 RepID=A0ABS9QHY0_9HYPH|nr:hypothetical protein [Mesorhizobium sp. IRAMC:0171]MCG7507038.1 hypothetical protein [Mesorhizobium sp. IRAMC:0171]